MLKRNPTLAQNREIDDYLFRDRLTNQNLLLEWRSETEIHNQNRETGKRGAGRRFYISIYSIRGYVQWAGNH